MHHGGATKKVKRKNEEKKVRMREGAIPLFFLVYTYMLQK
jgi:hypothetical protein